MKPGRWRPNTPDTFWSRCNNRGDPAACWEWQGYKTALGYGKLSFNSRVEKAHRVAWTITHGEIPRGMFVCHRCDNPPCCNPAHLFLGTPGDNTADMMKKRRHWSPGARNPLRGQHHYASKITDAQRQEIAASDEPQAELAARYGLTPSSVSRIQIMAGRRRRHTNRFGAARG